VIKVALRVSPGASLRPLTAFAIVLGVAMVSGTYVLTDRSRLRHDLHGLVPERRRGRQRQDPVREHEQHDRAPGPRVSARRSRLPGARTPSAGRYDQTHLVGGTASRSRPRRAEPRLQHQPRDQLFNPLKLVAGRWPVAPRDRDRQGTASSTTTGSVSRSACRARPRPFRIVGIADGRSRRSARNNLQPSRQAPVPEADQLDQIRVSKTAAIPTSRLLSEIRSILPPTAQARTGEQQAKQDASDTTSFLSFLQKFLLAFGFVALFVGAFVIVNTLSITIAQRTRELATLRTIGATRNQVLGSVLLESLVIGVLASIIGLFLGLLLAKGMDALFSAAGIDLPKTGTVFATRTVVVSLAIGILVTLLASLWPAYRSTRVPPIAAVREGSVLPPLRFARYAPLTAVL
jgi:hypothetical protein